MQAIQLPSPLNLPTQLVDSHASSADFAAKVNGDFSQKLSLYGGTPPPIDEHAPENQGLIQDSPRSETSAAEDDEDYDFSFAPNGPDSSPVSADELFCDGLIRPIFPLSCRDLLLASAAEDQLPSKSTASLRPPLKKLFSERRDPSPPPDVAGEGSGEAAAAAVVEETSPTVCKKSNSTGFSKLWRFRDIVRRSSSDGKDAFVFLNPSTAPAKTKRMKNHKVETLEATSVKKKGAKTASSSGSVRSPRRRSYLPYRLGFFASVDGMSRNVHPV